MADESLFDFLHMEIVSHVYKHSSKGEMDNKVSSVQAWNAPYTRHFTWTNLAQNNNNLLELFPRIELFVFLSWREWASEWDKDSLRGRMALTSSVCKMKYPISHYHVF